MSPIETGNGSMRGVGIRPDTVRVCVQLASRAQRTVTLKALSDHLTRLILNRFILFYFESSLSGKRIPCASLNHRSFYALATSISPKLCYPNNLVSLTPESKRRKCDPLTRACQTAQTKSQPGKLRAHRSKPKAYSSKTTTIIVIQLKFSFNSAEFPIHHGARHAPCVTDTHWPYFDHRVSIAEYTAVNAAQYAESVVTQHAKPVITQLAQHAKPIIRQ